MNFSLKKGKSILFDWRDTNQPHNIIHVELPNDKVVEFYLIQDYTFMHFNSQIKSSLVRTENSRRSLCIQFWQTSNKQ
jgi:hypothetical protein